MRSATSIALLAALSAGSAQGAVLLFDFGDPGQITAGNFNNLVHTPAGGSSLANCVDSLGNSTGIAATMTDAFWPGTNYNGTQTPASPAADIFPATATRDNFFGSVTAFSGVTEPTGGYAFSGLDPSGNTTYEFTFFGSRTSVTDNRETAYMLDGANSAIVYLNTANNINQVAVATGLIPDAGGNIGLTVGPGPNNTNASRFYYIAAMQIVSTTVPEPASLSALVVGSALLRRRR